MRDDDPDGARCDRKAKPMHSASRSDCEVMMFAIELIKHVSLVPQPRTSRRAEPREAGNSLTRNGSSMHRTDPVLAAAAFNCTRLNDLAVCLGFWKNTGEACDDCRRVCNIASQKKRPQNLACTLL